MAMDHEAAPDSPPAQTPHPPSAPCPHQKTRDTATAIVCQDCGAIIGELL